MPPYTSNLNTFTDCAILTPSDSADLPKVARAIYVGATGAIKLTTVEGTTLIFLAVAAGIFPIQAKKVFVADTDADNMIALF